MSTLFSATSDGSLIFDSHDVDPTKLASSKPVYNTSLLSLNSQLELGNLSRPGETPQIEHCDLVGQLEDINRAFFIAQAAANLAQYDASQGESSPFGFKALFKSQRAVFNVALNLNSIYRYATMNDLKPKVSKPKSPRFACVAQHTAAYYGNLDLTFDPWDRCRQPVRDGSPTQAFYADGTAYIFICPGFFQQDVMPPPSRGSTACPVVSNNRFAGDPSVFYRNYQIYTLLYQLIRFYLGSHALGRKGQPEEVFDWNLCVRNTILESTLNPTNILLYIASKYHSSVDKVHNLC